MRHHPRLFKRGAIWYGWIYDEHGERIQRSTKCTDVRAAETTLRRWEREASDPAHTASNQATIRDAIDLVFERSEEQVSSGRRSDHTVRFYRVKLGHVARILGEATTLRSLSATDGDEYRARREEEGASDHTIAKELGALRRALRLARRAKLWRGLPSDVLPDDLGTGYTPRARWLPSSEVWALIRELPADRAARVAFIAATSARLGESDRAQREDVSPGFVALRGTKTEASRRTVPIVLEEQEALMAYATEWGQGDAALFAPWGNVRRDLAAACERAGIAKATPNDLRRSFAHWFKQHGADETLVGPAMGHAPGSKVTAQVYAKLSPVELAAALRRAVAPVQQSAPESSGSSGRSGSKLHELPAFSVPRDGIEPPTRGFSSPVHKTQGVRIIRKGGRDVT